MVSIGYPLGVGISHILVVLMNDDLVFYQGITAVIVSTIQFESSRTHVSSHHVHLCIALQLEPNAKSDKNPFTRANQTNMITTPHLDL